MDERRIYSRIQSGISCLIYSDNREIVGVIKNISESGLAILIDRKAVLHEFRIGDQIMVTGLDMQEVIQFELEIMRIEEHDDHLILGAHTVNVHDVEPYVFEKKLELLKSIYLKNKSLNTQEDGEN